MYIWMGYGLWPKAVEQIVEHFLPRGPMRSLAMSMLREEFTKLDTRDVGVIQPAETIALIHRLMNPGLTCEGLADFLSASLSIDVPPREIHKYFTLMDVDGNGVLSVDEFIPMFRQLMLGYFPEHILRSLNLSPGQIAQFLIVIALGFIMVFVLITLVITTFAAGRDIVSVIHSGVTGVAGVLQSNLGNQSLGLESGMADLLRQLEDWIMAAIITTVGLSKTVVDRLVRVATELESGVVAGVVDGVEGAAAAVTTVVETATGTTPAPAAAAAAAPAANAATSS